MNEYGKLNGVPIEPGEGWEIVPVNDRLDRRTNMFTQDGENWRWLGPQWHEQEVSFVCVHNFSILAFRRPKTVQAGQGETVAIGKTALAIKDQTIEDLLKVSEQLHTELARLRTLTTAQSVALEKAEKELSAARSAVNILRLVDYEAYCTCFASIEQIDEALTLISAAKEVGK